MKNETKHLKNKKKKHKIYFFYKENSKTYKENGKWKMEKQEKLQLDEINSRQLMTSLQGNKLFTLINLFSLPPPSLSGDVHPRLYIKTPESKWILIKTYFLRLFVSC